MFVALAVGAVGLLIAGFNLSHNLGYWPHGAASTARAIQEQSNKTGKSENLQSESSVMQFLIFGLMIVSILAVGMLYYRGRRVTSRGSAASKTFEITSPLVSHLVEWNTVRRE